MILHKRVVIDDFLDSNLDEIEFEMRRTLTLLRFIGIIVSLYYLHRCNCIESNAKMDNAEVNEYLPKKKRKTHIKIMNVFRI